MTTRRRLSRGIFTISSLVIFGLIWQSPGVWRVLTICTCWTGTCKPSWASRWTSLDAPCKTPTSHSTPFYEGLVEANVKDHFKCWIYDLVFLLSGKIQLDLDVWTHLTANIDVMVLLRKSNCSSCNILEKRPSFDAKFLLLMICCRLLFTVKLLWIWSQKCQNKCNAAFLNYTDNMFVNYLHHNSVFKSLSGLNVTDQQKEKKDLDKFIGWK